MPFSVRREGKGLWGIYRRNPDGSYTKVGTSESKKKAYISASIRERESRKKHG